MPDTKISALAAGAPAVSTDVIPIQRGAANNSLTVGDISALSLPIGGGTLTGPLTEHITANGTFRQLDFTAVDPNNRRWNENLFTLANTGSARNNSAWQMGYNNAAAGGVSDVTDAAFYIQMESYYYPNGGAHMPAFEYHQNVYTANNGLMFRPFSTFAARDGSYCAVNYMADIIAITDRLGVQTLEIANTGIVAHVIAGGCGLSIYNNNVGAVQQLNAAGTQYINLGYVDGSNLLTIGGDVLSSCTGVYIPNTLHVLGDTTLDANLTVGSGSNAEITSNGALLVKGIGPGNETGVGMRIAYDTGFGSGGADLLAYNFTGGTFIPIRFRGSTIEFDPAGNTPSLYLGGGEVRIAQSSDKLGYFGATAVVRQLKANHNNWAALSDVVAVLVAYGLVDAA